MARYWLTALSPMARAFCAALSVSTRSRSFSRAGHPGTVDVLVLPGSADFRESDFGQAGVRRQLKRGDIFVTRSKTPYELDWKSPVGEELDFIIIHLAVNDDYEDGRRHPGRWQRRMTNRQMESAGQIGLEERDTILNAGVRRSCPSRNNRGWAHIQSDAHAAGRLDCEN
jgi:hypothetical protein